MVVSSMRDLHKLEQTMQNDSLLSLEDDQSLSSARGCSINGSSFRTSATSNKENTQTSESSTLVKEETRAVNRSKLLVLLVLSMAAVGVGIATYLIARQSEINEFEIKFHDFAMEVEELVHDEAQNVFLTIASFATTITSEAIASRATWPFYSVPHMEVRGMELNALSNSLMIAFSPLVAREHVAGWERYAGYAQSWIEEGVKYNIELHHDHSEQVEDLPDIYPSIYDNLHNRTPDAGDQPFLLPVWQQSPAPHDPHVIHYNLLRHEVFRRVFHGMNETLQPVLSEATDLEFFYGGSVRDEVTHPHSFLLQPIMEDFNQTHRDSSHIVGVAIAILPWDHYFENILPPEAHGIVVVMKDTCGDVFSYELNGAESVFLGYGDFHDPTYAHLEESSPFAPFQEHNFSETHSHCEYEMHIFPSKDLESDYLTHYPLLYALFVVGVFIVTALVFTTYDILVQRRQDKIMLTAKKSNAVVASLFPKNIRERIMKDVEDQILAGDGATSAKMAAKNLRLGAMPRAELKHFLDDGKANGVGVLFDSKPIADLFPHTTIMFGDIAGFTAWSSVREPTQVFTLLETLYHSFDEIAKRRRVFKVETIGDCYVAVSGLPEPRKDHATVMARFARDCIEAMNNLTKKLEVSLGPETGDLTMRVGLHSGPVTAGVLRGEKSRFQLFGDTVNTAARMESNGIPNRIHISKETADILVSTGKSHWVVQRKDKIEAKGKGFLQTYFLDINKHSSGSQTSGRSGSSDDGSAQLHAPHLASLCNSVAQPMDTAPVPQQLKRQIQWNADILLRMLRQIVARRNAEKKHGVHTSGKSAAGIPNDGSGFEGSNVFGTNKTAMEEVTEIVVLPAFNAEAAKNEENPSNVKLPDIVVNQMREYVTVIASLYNHDNPFHNFEHASHVTMSVVKLLSRIVAPEDFMKAQADDVLDQRLHDHTYGITSDPLTQFALAFSALIHDVDHEGVPNTQLIKEKYDIAAIYGNQSVAEQNSVDLAWALLMEDNFKELRRVICCTEEERKRFRQLVVNVVLATDIVDKDLKQLRNSRWDKAFSEEEATTQEEAATVVNRKATIVIEHIIQASDVAHTMQHWQIYRKWNELFFEENMTAYRAGRSARDPTEYWYQGELGFFDFYIIPLAKKLKECGVFGVSSDEYLNYALSNRKEWELQGKDVVAQMSAKYLQPVPEEMEEFQDEHPPS